MFTDYELTSNNAFILLHECGFQVFNHWETLSQFLHLPLDERKRLRESARISENYNLIIEEALDWWIAHSCHPSWEELVKAVDNCGERCTACEMRKRLCINIANSKKILHIFLGILSIYVYICMSTCFKEDTANCMIMTTLYALNI